MYVVAKESNYNDDRFIFLVNRKVTRERWWTSFLNQALVYKDKNDAEIKAASLHDAFVMTLDEAYQSLEDDLQEGWDEHK